MTPGAAPNEPGCTCPRFDPSLDEGLPFPLCPKHEWLGALRTTTLALMLIDTWAAAHRDRSERIISALREDAEFQQEMAAEGAASAPELPA